MTITEFLAKHPLTLSATSIPWRSDVKNDPKWEADHWRLTIAYPDTTREVFTREYSTGIGHRKEVRKDYNTTRKVTVPVAPSLATVLESLSLDASCADQTFNDWCADLGYDTDSRKALDTYLACQQIATDLRALLGYDGMADLQSVDW